MMNHSSFLDPWVCPQFGHIPSYVVKEKDKNNPMLSAHLNLFDCYVLSNNRSKVLKDLVER